MNRAFLFAAFLALFITVHSVAAAEQFLHTRNALPETNNELQLDDSFKTNLFTGSFSYYYAIQVPPGTNDLQPALHVFYNNHKTTDKPTFLGTGWDITQSYIERDVNSSVEDTSDDDFLLFLDGGSYDLVYSGSEGRFYTKTQSFLFIQNKSTANNEKGEYWIVRSTDGTEYRFGFTQDAELVSQSGEYVLRYYVDRVTDTYNNSITYQYSENPFSDIHTTYPWNISYNNDESRIITFTYEDSDRPDIWEYYSNGNTIKTRRRLSEINVTANGETVRLYKLQYTTFDIAEARSFLANITLFGSDEATSLPTTTFGYRPNSTGWTNDSDWDPPLCFAEPNAKDDGVRIADVNGDGLPDILRAERSTDCDNPINLAAYINNGTTWLSNSTWHPPICFTEVSQSRSDGTLIADVNGDGLPDILRAIGANCDSPSSTAAYINTGHGWESDANWTPPICFVTTAGSMHDDSGARLVDVNGDGLVDIIRSLGGNCDSPSTAQAFINNGNGWTEDASWEPPLCFIDVSGSNYRDAGTRIADVNGDGLPDILRSLGATCDNPGTERAYVNNGNGWTSNSDWFSPLCFIYTSGSLHNDSGTRLVDVNGDGLTDVIRGEGNATCLNPGDNRSFINNGLGWTEDASWEPPLCFTSNYKDQATRVLDVNGDGSADLIRSLAGADCDSPSDQESFVSNNNRSYVLSEINNTMGGSISIEYMRSTSLDNTGNDAGPDLNFNIWVVSSITRQNGMNGTSAVASVSTYNYSGGFYDHEKDELRGFAFVEEHAPNGATIFHYFHQDDGRSGREFKTQLFDNASSLFQQQEFDWNVTENTTSDVVYYIPFLLEENTSTFDGLGGDPKTSRISYTYDDFGNVLSRTSHGDINSSGDERYETYAYATNSSAWIVNTRSSFRLRDADNETIRESNLSYDGLGYGDAPLKGSVTKKEDLLDSEQPATAISSFVYDTYGNVIEHTDPNNHSTQYVYGSVEATSTFPDQEINAKGQVTGYGYDLGFGVVRSVTDPNGAVTTYTYDTLGRRSKEILPLDSESRPTRQYEYERDGAPPERVITRSREVNTSNATFDTIQFLDGFGTVVAEQQEAEYSQHIRVDLFFDDADRLERRSNPYFMPSQEDYSDPDLSVNSTAMTYDPLDRVLSITNPDGTRRTFTYGKWNTTNTNENGNQVIQTRDAFDQITDVYEGNDGETYRTRYEYDAAGGMTGITDNEGNVLAFVYDEAGRQVSTTDPDRGTWNYSYDAAGNLVKQIDSRGIATDMQYDEMNRVIQKNSSAEIYLYAYDQQKNGTLSGVSGPSYVTNLTYDERLRLVEETKTITGNLTTTFYVYDSLDRISYMTLPGGKNITFSYNDQNQLESIDGILDNIDYTELNTVTARAYGNSLVTNFTYDPENIRLTSIRTGSQQNLSYAYDNVSNVVSIDDSANSFLLSLAYDDLDRLVLAHREDTGEHRENFSIVYDYSSIGNILSVKLNNNTNITYTYGKNPSHSPKGIEQFGPDLQITNLRHLSTNGSMEVYGFDIANNGPDTLSDISWAFHSGDESVFSQESVSLASGEEIWVVLAVNESGVPDTARQVASSATGEIWDTRSLQAYNPDSNTTHAFTYDGNRNIRQDAQFYYEYNNFNQLERVRVDNSSGIILEEYLYDHDGNRIYKKTPSDVTLYYNKNYLRVYDGGTSPDQIYYYYDQDTLIAEETDELAFYHPDHLGSTTLITNQSAAVVQETHYLPFGLPLYNADSRYLYTGKELDQGTGLQYYGARYYSPEFRLFISPDSIIPDPYNPQTLNRYGYTLNNPYKYTDPSGNYAKIGVGAGISIGLDIIFNQGNIGVGKALVSGLASKATSTILASHMAKIGRVNPSLTQKPLTQWQIGEKTISQITGFEGPTVIEGVITPIINPFGAIPDLLGIATEPRILDEFAKAEPFLVINPFTGKLDPGLIPEALGVDPNLAYQYISSTNQYTYTQMYDYGSFEGYYYPSDYYTYEEYQEASDECQCSPDV